MGLVELGIPDVSDWALVELGILKVIPRKGKERGQFLGLEKTRCLVIRG